MSAKLSDVLEALNDINRGVEQVIVHNDDLRSIKFVLDETDYTYLESPTNYEYTMIKIK